MTADREPLDLDEITEKWLNECGACDFGLSEYGCHCPADEENYRPVMLTLVREVQRLQAELARWESGQRRKGLPVVESVPDGLHYAALLVRSIGTEGGEEHDRLLAEASQRLKRLSDLASYLLAAQQRDDEIAEAARAWRRAGIWAIGHPPDFTAMQETKVALMAAIDRAYPGDER